MAGTKQNAIKANDRKNLRRAGAFDLIDVGNIEQATNFELLEQIRDYPERFSFLDQFLIHGDLLFVRFLNIGYIQSTPQFEATQHL